MNFQWYEEETQNRIAIKNVDTPSERDAFGVYYVKFLQQEVSCIGFHLLFFVMQFYWSFYKEISSTFGKSTADSCGQFPSEKNSCEL